MRDLNSAFSLIERIKADHRVLQQYFERVIDPKSGSVWSTETESTYTVHITTGAWAENSENEAAMSDTFENFGIAYFWHSTTRGGYYEFHVPRL